MAAKKERDAAHEHSEISQIIMEGEGLLKTSTGMDVIQPIHSFKSAPENGLDGSFSLENRSYQFFLDNNDSFYADAKKSPFHTAEPINKQQADKILFKEIKFEEPPRRGGRHRDMLSCPQLVDPDESLDIGTGAFQRKRKASDSPDHCALPSKPMLEGRTSADVSFTKLPGFKTAEGSHLYIKEEFADRGRRSLDFLHSGKSKCPPPAPKVVLPREFEMQEAMEAYRKMKQEIFPLTRSEEEEFNLFELFRWSWVAVLPHIREIKKRGSEECGKEIQAVVLEEAKRRWKLNPKSVLKRIVEHDEHPAVYMKVLVVEEGRECITITDGVHSVKARLDAQLQKISGKIRSGHVLQVACSVLLSSCPISIYEAHLDKRPVIELRYNGVKPCLSGPLGYQSTHGYIRELSSIDASGGDISCLMLNVTKHINTNYIIDINGSKTTIEEERLESTLERIERSIENLGLPRDEKMRAIDSVKVHKYTRYNVVCDYSSNKTPGILSVWEPAFTDNRLSIHKRYLFFMVRPPTKALSSSTVLLTTTSKTFFIKI
ncbi:uncharacterized protein NEMAJ01_1257 [Nematocida major]|uniref:uncharacterized protein n=1 Tax=Nematocida major TaxID=1912982 RepID=UPI00200776E1|nr:uncharacterized protein NEMAJ01_1257 [Nematocida major]KAH9386361.1 hypothetical protein NEMAJ01_1257 [Nematocida major]